MSSHRRQVCEKIISHRGSHVSMELFVKDHKGTYPRVWRAGTSLTRSSSKVKPSLYSYQSHERYPIYTKKCPAEHFVLQNSNCTSLAVLVYGITVAVCLEILKGRLARHIPIALFALHITMESKDQTSGCLCQRSEEGSRKECHGKERHHG